MHKLNERQRAHVLHVVMNLQEKQNVYNFVAGSAEVRKIVLIEEAICQTLARYQMTIPGTSTGAYMYMSINYINYVY